MAKFDPKAKAKKQKIVAAVLGVVLLGVLAWQVPSLMKTLNKKPPPLAAPAPAPAPLPGASGTVAPPAAGTAVAAPVSSGTLIDSDPAAQAAGGQLLTFDRFESKDPFAQQLGAQGARPAGKRWKGRLTLPPPPPPPPPPPAAKTPTAVTAARISVNGAPEQVGIGARFPQADPLFVLVSLTRTTAKVGISDGTLDTGSATVTLKKGKKLTLQNTVDGARYELLLIATS
jgi:hypothetical protein